MSEYNAADEYNKANDREIPRASGQIGDRDADGFTRTLHFYQRGLGDPPGNGWVWMCHQCDQVKAKGHAPDCPYLREAK